MNERLELTDSTLDIMRKMSDGNPGAIQVLTRMLVEGDEIDPQSWSGSLGSILGLDMHGIYGSRIWMLHKDVCGEDIVKTSALLRAVQLGKVSEIAIHHAIDFRGEGIDVDELLAEVMEALPEFNRSAQPRQNIKMPLSRLNHANQRII